MAHMAVLTHDTLNHEQDMIVNIIRMMDQIDVVTHTACGVAVFVCISLVDGFVEITSGRLVLRSGNKQTIQALVNTTVEKLITNNSYKHPIDNAVSL